MGILQRSPQPDPRTFLKGAAVGGTAAIGSGSTAWAKPAAAPPEASAITTPGDAARSAAFGLVQAGAAANTNTDAEPPVTVSDPSSDFLVDVIKALDIDCLAVNPSGSIRRRHEPIIHYGGNTKPELISVDHEEIGVAIAHGYAHAAGKAMAALSATRSRYRRCNVDRLHTRCQDSSKMPKQGRSSI